MKKKLRKVAIVGTASTSAGAAPYDDPSWEIWNIARNFTLNKRFDLWFELHTIEVLQAAKAVPQYIDFLRKHGSKVICGIPQAELPEATPYPLQQILTAFPRQYFTCSAAWMIALAIYWKVDEIGLWGIDMVDSASGEYAYQRPACEYYLGIAEAKGIKVTMAPQSPLLRCHGLYAFSDLAFSREMTERITELQTVNHQHKIAAEEAQKQLLENTARLNLLQEISSRWGL